MLRKRTVARFQMTQETVINPLIGWVPHASYLSEAEKYSMVYADMTWRELEPEEGVFAFEAIEQKKHLKRWREEGKHAVLRLVNDYPRPAAHMDIPDWLYEKTGKDGTFYDHAYGKGYSPNYANSVFIEHHKKAVEALGGWFGKDAFVSYVQLGSLGHWGEWHVKLKSGIPAFPPKNIQKLYVTSYIEAFPHAKLLMRRPFEMAKELGLGLYNDVMGDAIETRKWLDWIEWGGSFEQTNEENALVPMTHAWQKVPIGGELTSSVPMPQLLTTNIEQTVAMIQESHASFLGPQIPILTEESPSAYQTGKEKILQTLGYRIGVTRTVWNVSAKKVTLILTWTNEGIAPLYWDWPVYLYLTGKEETAVFKVPVELKLTQLLPGKKLNTTTKFSLDKWGGKANALSVGIEDPMTGLPAVQLVSDQEKMGKLSVLKRVEEE